MPQLKLTITKSMIEDFGIEVSTFAGFVEVTLMSMTAC